MNLSLNGLISFRIINIHSKQYIISNMYICNNNDLLDVKMLKLIVLHSERKYDKINYTKNQFVLEKKVL